jgi:hypothetical protein
VVWEFDWPIFYLAKLLTPFCGPGLPGARSNSGKIVRKRAAHPDNFMVLHTANKKSPRHGGIGGQTETDTHIVWKCAAPVLLVLSANCREFVIFHRAPALAYNASAKGKHDA